MPQLRFNLGEALRRLGRDADAEEAYREALRLDPRFGPAEVALLHLMEKSAQSTRRFATAKDSCIVNRAMLDVLELVGLLLMRESRWAEAAKKFEQALAVAPQSLVARHNLAAAQSHLRGTETTN